MLVTQDPKADLPALVVGDPMVLEIQARAARVAMPHGGPTRVAALQPRIPSAAPPKQASSAVRRMKTGSR